MYQSCLHALGTDAAHLPTPKRWLCFVLFFSSVPEPYSPVTGTPRIFQKKVERARMYGSLPIPLLDDSREASSCPDGFVP
jgi:hypothetical protein